jgi:type VI protein secretion system component VasK
MHTEHVLYTLVDITDTGSNNPKGSTMEFRQAQNLNSLIQVLSMRTQPLYLTVTKIDNVSMSDYVFGSQFKDNNTVWKMTFTTDAQDAYRSLEGEYAHLINDCNNVPIHTELTETIKLNPSSLSTKNKKIKNIYFI